MPRPRFIPTEEQRRTVKTMAMCGARHENIALKLEITPKTLRKHFRREITLGVIDAHLAIRNTLFKMATSGRNIAATIHADRLWDKFCASRTEADGQATLPPQIIIRTEGESLASAAGGPDR